MKYFKLVRIYRSLNKIFDEKTVDVSFDFFQYY